MSPRAKIPAIRKKASSSTRGTRAMKRYERISLLRMRQSSFLRTKRSSANRPHATKT
jgi:hypothetical protein